MPTVAGQIKDIYHKLQLLTAQIAPIGAIPDETREPTGFVDATEVSLSFNDVNRKLTIAPVGASFSFYYDGTLFTKVASETITIPNVEGVHLVYYDSTGTLQQIANPTHAQIETAIRTYCMTAWVYWDVSEATGLVANELHGCIMDNETHLYLHDIFSARYDTGMGLGDFVISDGADAEDAQFSVAEGTFFDEDIEFKIAAVGKLIGLQIWYRVAADWYWTINAGFSVVTTGTGRLGYDNAGALTEVTNNNFVLCHIFASHIGAAAPTYIAIVGQAQYANKNAARDGAETEIASLAVPGTVVVEGAPIATIIFQTSNAYGNAVKARVVQTNTGENYIDWRASAISSGTAAGDHGLLSGLGDDDHTQYLLVDGTRAMTGALDMGNQNIINPGTGHDAFTDALADEHIGHSTVDITAGTGLTGGGNIAATRTIDVDVGIGNNEIPPVTVAGVVATDYARFTAAGLEGRHPTELLADCSAQCGAAFDWNTQNLTNVGTISCTGPFTINQNADTVVLSHDGTDAFIEWNDGVLNFQTAEVNAVTTIHLHPNGINEESEILFYDKDGIRLAVSVAADAAFIRSVAANLNLQGNQPNNIVCWNSIAAGNPVFFIYGWETGVARRWGRMYVSAAGELHIGAEQGSIVCDQDVKVLGSISMVDASTTAIEAENDSFLIAFFHTHSNTNWHAPYFYLRRSRGTNAIPLAVIDNDIIGGYDFIEYDGSDYARGAQILVRADGAPTDVGNIVPMDMEFNTMNAAGAFATRLHIAAEGYISISNIRSGATQVAAGAGADELWKTAGHATLPNNVVMIGV